ncbi:DUF3370 domain-containing protein [Spirulina subsalsa FACHB-351]|uniref:DUF3370 domain-containing protein n=1 Tax=Spirulina subsalsa FACHB-351 TaxID=234711 RepID=A0ABT3L0Q3_9CYAN|nr:DUF3370 domain-containing protein [Spirulina subsalsa]MCW6035081.1 DUF3370 domain-containing protein [Spirulina subsalsa FACHB-351]
MFSLLSLLFLAQTPTPPPPQEIVRPQEVRPLPGELDQVPVFNSNSPELVLERGILLSTFPPEEKAHPEAHLNFGFEGRFDVFAHHVAKAPTPEDLRTLYLGVLIHNPGDRPVTLRLRQAASYLSQPDAPFISLPPVRENRFGEVYAGPGSRVMSDLVRGRRQRQFPAQIIIPAGESRMLMNLPIPVRTLEPPLNGRSSYFRLESTGKVYVASLAQFAPTDEQGEERSPTLEEWQELLVNGQLATPRDRTPTPPGSTEGSFIYGRVAGVAQGSQWQARLTDPDRDYLTIPEVGQAFSYGISTLDRGTLGTGQIQSAPMLVRYPDTAYKAHGNYGIEYRLTLPLHNPSDQPKTVTLTLETPIKQNELEGGLRFFDPLPTATFFRGTVQVQYPDSTGNFQTRHFHLVQRRGQQGVPLVTLNLDPQETKTVGFNFLYPPDATPPQVVTVQTLPINSNQ